jgi:Ca2+-binding RTX toxin-like protein
MSLDSVIASITFWDDKSDWGYVPKAIIQREYTEDEKTRILNSVSSLYQTESGLAMLEQLSVSGKLRFGYGSDDGATAKGPGGYFVISPDLADDNYFMNDQGKLVQDDLRLVIGHEMGHAAYDYDDGAEGTPSQMDDPNFIYRPDVTNLQNRLANELGLSDHIQASYYFAFDSGTVSSRDLEIGKEYTQGNHVDIARITKVDGANMNMSGRSSDNLLIGDWRDNTIVGGSGRDYIYGCDGENNISGGAGNDFLFGGADRDVITGGDDNDVLSGGGGEDYLYGDGGNDAIYGGEGENYIYGGDGDDLLVSSSDADHWDTVHGDNGNDYIVITNPDTWPTVVGGKGNDTIDIGNGTVLDGEGYVEIDFAKGDGRDTVINGTQSNSGIFFSGITSSEISIVWNARVTNSENVGELGNLYELEGDLAISIDGTNDSIFMGNVKGSAIGPDEGSFLGVSSKNYNLGASISGIYVNGEYIRINQLKYVQSNAGIYNVAQSQYTGPSIDPTLLNDGSTQEAMSTESLKMTSSFAEAVAGFAPHKGNSSDFQSRTNSDVDRSSEVFARSAVYHHHYALA